MNVNVTTCKCERHAFLQFTVERCTCFCEVFLDNCPPVVFGCIGKGACRPPFFFGYCRLQLLPHRDTWNQPDERSFNANLPLPQTFPKARKGGSPYTDKVDETRGATDVVESTPLPCPPFLFNAGDIIFFYSRLRRRIVLLNPIFAFTPEPRRQKW